MHTDLLVVEQSAEKHKKLKKNVRDCWFSIPEGCEIRKGSQPIDWLPFQPKTILNGEYLIRLPQNDSKDLEEIAATYKSGFPVIRDTEFDILFQPDGIKLVLGEGEQFNTGEMFMLVAEHLPTKTIVSSIMLRMWKKQRNIEFVAIATHETHQKTGIGRALVDIADEYIEQCGVEMAFVWAAVEHTFSQRILVDCGFHFLAVVPGFYRIWAGDNTYRRSSEVLGQKFYHHAEKMNTRELHLLPEVSEMISDTLSDYSIST